MTPLRAADAGAVVFAREVASRGGPEIAPMRRSVRRIRRAVSALALAAFVAFVAEKWRALATSSERLGHAQWIWIVLAVALESASMATFARVQRRLLRVGGQRVGNRAMMPIIYAANALSVSVPVAGPELGVAFTFRRFKLQGAEASLASWSLFTGGLVSWVGAILVLLSGGVLSAMRL
ncbi:MAG: putative rane protein [Acidimicrobiaceae bacterium]|nr:putative rane protein [Acidimicrobiaceae bacterium]